MATMIIEVKAVAYDDPKQAADLVALLDHYSCDPMGSGKPLDDGVKERLASEMKKRPHVGSAIVYVDDQPAGLVNFIEGFSTFNARSLINIHDVVVHRDFRGQGLSRKLFEFVEAEAAKRGCCKVTLEVLGGNEVAKSAYRNFGYSAYGLSEETGAAEFWEKKIG